MTLACDWHIHYRVVTDERVLTKYVHMSGCFTRDWYYKQGIKLIFSVEQELQRLLNNIEGSGGESLNSALILLDPTQAFHICWKYGLHESRLIHTIWFIKLRDYVCFPQELKQKTLMVSLVVNICSNYPFTVDQVHDHTAVWPSACMLAASSGSDDVAWLARFIRCNTDATRPEFTIKLSDGCYSMFLLAD